MEYIGLIALMAFFILIYFIPVIYNEIKIRNKIMKGSDENINGYLYVVSNPMFKDNLFKIGMTSKDDYNKRIKGLDNTSIPLPFDIEIIVPHHNPKALETFLHKRFKKYRIRNRREFFLMKKSLIKKELKRLNLN